MQRSQGRGFARRELHGTMRISQPTECGFYENAQQSQPSAMFWTTADLPKTDFDDFEIHECSSVSFFGLTFDSSLSWFPHISKLFGKLSRTSQVFEFYTLLEFSRDPVPTHSIFN